ncbi:MAG TPA: GTP-binding protein [archaeon]|nr:GTP-binding protein [archaeon]
MTIEDQIKTIEEELARTQYNKHTQFHIGQLKAKLARLRAEQEERSKKKAGAGYFVKKTGDATVLLVGFPSVGKSTLINKITKVDSKVGAYDFTTLNVIPGVMEYNSARIQILDMPGIIEGASEGKGLGKQILAAVRNADLVVIMVDAHRAEQADIIRKELYNAGFRLNQKPPDVKVVRKSKGGIELASTVKLRRISKEEIRSVLGQFGIMNADVLIREDITPEQLIDSLLRNRVYVPAVFAVNKVDTLTPEEARSLPRDFVLISAEKSQGLEQLKKAIWERLGLSRIYLKKIGKDPDMKEPMIIKGSPSVMDVCEKIHKEFARNLRFARVWGRTAKFPGQKVGGEHRLADRDIVELHV